MTSPVKTERNGKVLEITLDRPKANAIDVPTSHRLGEVFIQFRDDPELLVAILTGAGEKFFSGGWDLKAAAGGEGAESDFGPGGFAGLTEIFDLNKPVIAAVNGYAIGGGFELALACDLIVAAEHALFYLPEAGWGIIPAAGGVQRLPRRLPQAVAMEIMLTGRHMGAEEAARHGLINRVVPLPRLLETAREMAGQIAEKAPLSIMSIKQVVRGTEDVSVEEAFRMIHGGAFPLFQRLLESEDAKEGPRSFAEKRKPNFKGR
jgi:crotonobetainyl-CoA hydratase